MGIAEAGLLPQKAGKFFLPGREKSSCRAGRKKEKGMWERMKKKKARCPMEEPCFSF